MPRAGAFISDASTEHAHARRRRTDRCLRIGVEIIALLGRRYLVGAGHETDIDTSAIAIEWIYPLVISVPAQELPRATSSSFIVHFYGISNAKQLCVLSDSPSSLLRCWPLYEIVSERVSPFDRSGKFVQINSDWTGSRRRQVNTGTN